MDAQIEKFKTMTNEIKINNLNDTIKFSKKVAKELLPSDVVCLFGDLGVGKTVISKEICNSFGVTDFVISPTFNLLKSYKTNDKSIKIIHHFDLYRLNCEEDLINIGFEDYITDKNAICLIEWPKFAIDLLNNQYIKIEIFYNDKIDGRLIKYERIKK